MKRALIRQQMRQAFPRAFALALVAWLALGCGGAVGEQTVATPRSAGVGGGLSARQATIDPTQLARRIHELVNVERERFGLRPLDWQAALGPVATGHSNDMANRDYFSHNSPEGGNFLMRYKARGFQC